MIELNKKTKDNGVTSTLKFEVQRGDEGLIVQFVQFEQGSNNKWHNPKVVTDVFVDRYCLQDKYSIADESGSRVEDYILDCCEKDIDVVGEIEKLSKWVDHVGISLPTTKYYNNGNRYHGWIKDTIFPLIVKINGKDVSRDFFDFDLFREKAVNVAYEALIDGKAPQANNTLTDFTGVQKLHEKLFSRVQEDPMP